MQKSVARRGLDVRELRPGLAVCAKVHPDTSLSPPPPLHGGFEPRLLRC
jgi:hypothetical protein